MMKWVWVFVLMNYLVNAGEILETNDFGLIESEIDKLEVNSLVVFDVDDTLITPNDAILKPVGKECFKHLISGHTDRNLFREILVKAPHSILDERSRPLIQRLKEKNIVTVALTAARPKVKRDDVPCDWRIDDLKNRGFDFSSAFAEYGCLEFLKDSNALQAPMFKKGILFSAFHPKGMVLVNFLQAVNFVPTKVIFIDDEIKNVESVVKELEKKGIFCLGIHYTAAEDCIAHLDADWAAFQVNHFLLNDVWLGDDLRAKSINIAQ